MKNLTILFLIVTSIACSEQKEIFIISPLEITIEEDTTSLKLDKKGLIYQNEIAIGKLEQNRVTDIEGNEIFSFNERFIIVDVNKDTIEDLSNKYISLDDKFLGVFKWSSAGHIESKDGTRLGIQLTPNDTTLYRTASLILHYGQYLRNKNN